MLVAAALAGQSACATGTPPPAVDAAALNEVMNEASREPVASSPATPAPPAGAAPRAPDERGVVPEAPRVVNTAVEVLLPPFDAEAEARARQEAAREAFEQAWPQHGIAYHFLAQVHARADASSPVVGYMRRGSRFRAKAAVRGPGCARGWSEVVGGGFVCRGEGFSIGEGPQTFEPSPVAPALEDALPYAYGYVAREEAPQFWRLPTADEERATAPVMGRLRELAALRAGAAVAGEPGAEPDLEAPPGQRADPGARALPGSDAGVGDALLPEFLRMRMERGFYVSLDREEADGERRFFRTIRGNYVPSEVLAEAHPSTMRGVVLGGEWQLPLGFVFRRGVHALVRDAVSGNFSQGDAVPANTPWMLEEGGIERRGGRYLVARTGVVISERALRVPLPISRPAGVEQTDRWVHVDLSDQTLVAYEGDRPVFTTMVSTGREGFETPVGTFRVQSKHVSTTMEDIEGGAEAYSIEDVPWTMYFEGSYALHGAFWHDAFGRVRSHGCVNLAPADARWLFQWSWPMLPPGWHGVLSGPGRPGTFVHITP